MSSTSATTLTVRAGGQFCSTGGRSKPVSAKSLPRTYTVPIVNGRVVEVTGP